MVTRIALSHHCILARRLKSLLAAVGLAITLGLAAAPAPTAACTGGCVESGTTLIREAHSIVLAKYRETVGDYAVLEVLDVLKGPARGSIRLYWKVMNGGTREWRTVRWIAIGRDPGARCSR